MKKGLLMFIVLLTAMTSIAIPVCQASLEAVVPDRPNFVWHNMLWFEQTYPKKQDQAWARMFGWGKGIYISTSGEVPFVWLLWCNTDGYIQMEVSVPFEPEHLEGLKQLKENDDHWEGHVAKEGGTWIGTAHEWFEHNCKDLTFEQCNNKATMDEVATIFDSLPFIKEVKVAEYLP